MVTHKVEQGLRAILGTLIGQVIVGNQLGRKIGFPTANLYIDPTKAQLANGVYGVEVQYNQRSYTGIMNVGVRPTIRQDETQVHYEVHIFDFDEMIYGKLLQVEVCFFIREERSFSSLEALIAQIHSDVEYVKQQTGSFSDSPVFMENVG